jgi:hypothetical protein
MHNMFIVVMLFLRYKTLVTVYTEPRVNNRTAKLVMVRLDASVGVRGMHGMLEVPLSCKSRLAVSEEASGRDRKQPAPIEGIQTVPLAKEITSIFYNDFTIFYICTKSDNMYWGPRVEVPM